jgi:hypothetical protein
MSYSPVSIADTWQSIEAKLHFVENADLAGGRARLLQRKPFSEAGLFAGLQLETDTPVPLVWLPVIAQGEQQVVRYAFRESLATDLTFHQVAAKDAEWRDKVRHQDRPRSPMIKSFLSFVGMALPLNGRKPPGEEISDDDEDGREDEQARDLFFVDIVEHLCYFSTATVISLSPVARIKATDSFEA